MKRIRPFIVYLSILFISLCVVQAQEIAESDDFSYALKLYNEKFYDLAAQQFTRFVNRYPASDKLAEAGYYTGMSLFNLGEFENARIEFQRVAVDFPQENRAADSWFMIGECYEKLNNTSEAAKAYEMIKLLHPNHQYAAKSILRAGQLYQNMNNLEKAEQLYNLIQNRYIESSEYFNAILAHGRLFVQNGEYGRAVDKLNKVLEGNTSSELKAESLLILGEMYRFQGFPTRAKEPLNRILKEYPNTQPSVTAALTLSKILLNEGASADVQKILTTALKSATDEDIMAELTEKLADAYFMNGQFALASNHYEKSIPAVKNDKYMTRKLKMALCIVKMGNITQALNTLEPALLDLEMRGLPGYYESIDYCLKACFDNNMLKRGIAILLALEKKRELNADELRWLAKLLQTDGAWNTIVQKFESIVYTQPSNPDIDLYLFDLGYAFENLNRYHDSQKYLERLINEYPASELAELAQERLVYLQRYHLVDESVSVDGLALLMGDFIKGDDPGILNFRMGRMYFDNLKNYAQAIVHFDLALSSGSGEVRKADVLYFSGLAHKYLAEREGTSQADRTKHLNLAREKFSAAMENLQGASDPALISWKFVELGSELDNAPAEKQISYYSTLLTKYPDNPYSEFWHRELIHLNSADSSSSKAAEHFRILIREYPSSEKLADYLVEYAETGGNNDEMNVSEIYKKVALEYPATRAAAKALLHLGQMAEQKEIYSEALQYYNKLIDDYFYSDLAGQARRRLGDMQFMAGKINEALEQYQKDISSLPPDDPILQKSFLSGQQINIYYKLGRAYHAQGNRRAAQENIAYFLLSSTDDLFVDDARLLLGDIYLALGDKTSAVESLSRVSNKDPHVYQKSLQKIADTYFQLGQYPDASRAYENLAATMQGQEVESDAYAKGIIASIRSGNISESEKKISRFNKKFKKSDAHSAAFTFEFGDYYRRNSNFKKAQDFFTVVINKYGKSSYADDAEYFLALTYITLNKQKEALDILSAFTQKYPSSEKLGAVYNTLGSIYFRSEKYESALSSFKRASEKPLDSELRRQVMSNLIRTYTFVNFWDAALALAKDYIKEFPQSEDLIDKKILIGRAFTYLNQVDLAVEYLKETRLIADSEREPEIQFYVGDAYFKSGQYENAIAEFVKIPFLSRKTKLQWEASALYYSGQAYEKLGRIDDAIRMYQEIVKRPGIDLVLKKDAQKRIEQIRG